MFAAVMNSQQERLVFVATVHEESLPETLPQQARTLHTILRSKLHVKPVPGRDAGGLRAPSLTYLVVKVPDLQIPQNGE